MKGTISFSCDACGRSIRTPASYAGKTARCPGCRSSIRAPLADEPAPPAAPEPVARRTAGGDPTFGGFVLMAGAVLWFVVGLSAGKVYFYPPILFVVGLSSFLRGSQGGGRRVPASS